MHTPPAITLHIAVQSTYASGNNEQAKPGQLPPPTGLIRIPFKLKATFNKHFSALWQQQRIDETYETVTGPRGPILGPSYDDVANTWALVWSPQKATTFSLGYYQRRTACCPYGLNDEHLPFVAVERDFGKTTRGKPLARVRFTLLRSLHHVAAPTGDEGDKTLYRAFAQFFVPVKPKLFAVAKAGVFSDYFNAQPFPFYYNYVNYGLAATVAKNVTYSMMVDTLTQHVQGQPFPAPEALHRSKFVVTADFKL